MKDGQYAFMQEVSKKVQDVVRKDVVELVLSTDMKQVSGSMGKHGRGGRSLVLRCTPVLTSRALQQMHLSASPVCARHCLKQLHALSNLHSACAGPC